MPTAQLMVHTNYAMNGSLIRINELVKRAVDYNYSSLAIADPRMYGTVAFYKACKKHGIKPIIGLQITSEGIHAEGTNQFILYAKNNTGYQNLLEIASYSSHHTVTLTELKQKQEGIVAVLISSTSEILQAHNNHQKPLIEEFMNWFKTIFSNAYISLSAQDDFNKDMELYCSLIALPRVMYLDQEDKEVSNVLTQIFQVQDTSLLGVDDSHHLLTQQEMTKRYQAYPEALQALDEIADMCDVTLDFSTTHLPSYPLKKNVSAKEYLHALAYKGLNKRLQGTKKNTTIYKERLSYELEVIDQMGYNDYFLIVWDFVKYAKQNGYLVGPGRGSAAASLVSYCLGITSVDSVEFNLVFERFLNPERITLPDIDMDLPDDKRDDIISYVRDFYGMDRVSSICTFGTFLSKSAIRDTARIVGLEGILLDQLIKETANYDSIMQMIESSATIQNIIAQQETAKKVLEVASRVEGLHRHVSTHAAGIIITEDKMTNHTAVQPGLLDMFQTQYEAKDLEQLGLLKIDFLGLRNLSSIHRIVELIQTEEKQTIDVYKIPLDDQKTFDLLKRVETTGIFQLESKGMRRLIGDMQIDSFEDIVTILALFRPGPMENIPTYLKRRFKEEKVTYPDPIVKDILEPTSGIIIYQEQIIQIASTYAGYSLGEADLLRRAVSKKQESVLNQERANFLKKAHQLGRNPETSKEIYDYIVKFANYGFNRAHSVAYAMVSYWMAYLKANYPKYFISILTSSVIGSERQLREYIFESNKLGVPIMPPSINASTSIFRPYEDTLLYPLLGIKNVGISSVKEIEKERENGEFTSFVDFVKRMNKQINKRVVESLIYAGALDQFKHTKRAMIEQLDDVINYTLYGDFIEQDAFVLKTMEEYPYDHLRQKEFEVLGFNLFVNPLNKYREYINKHNLFVPSTLEEKHLNTELKLVGILSSLRPIKTKNNKDMAFMTLEDEHIKLSCVLFTRTYNMYKDLLEKSSVYLVKGTLEQRSREQQLIITHIHRL
jgi:DNA polymerase-3 subunit alpha